MTTKAGLQPRKPLDPAQWIPSPSAHASHYVFPRKLTAKHRADFVRLRLHGMSVQWAAFWATSRHTADDCRSAGHARVAREMASTGMYIYSYTGDKTCCLVPKEVLDQLENP